jgi:TonB family protein
MMELEQRAKIYGAAGTILFHIVLLLLLWFLVMSRIVPNEEEGLAVSIGVDANGGNDFFEPAPASLIEGLLVPSTVNPSSGAEEFQTQDIEESISAPPQKKKTEEELRREQELKALQRQKELEWREEQRKIAEAKALQEAQDKKAQEIGNQTKNLFGGNGAGGSGNSNTSSGQGNGQGSGSQGNPFGSPDATRNGEGAGLGTGGNSWSLAGRALNGVLVKPTYNVYEEGKIVVTIIVDKEGMVISAVVGNGTNIDNPILRKAAVEAAQKTKFNKITTEKNQSGTITYLFKLQ